MTAGVVVRFARELARMMPRRFTLALVLTVAVTAGEAAGVLLLTRLLALAGVGTLAGAAGALPRAVDRAFAALNMRPSLGAVLAVFVVVVVGVAMLQRTATLL
ncbi:MAG TPA: hypothetical protein VFY65_06010, partial [Longimicrobium sp.]|nr:hypothetical protein [Longimicrobium sp.]